MGYNNGVSFLNEACKTFWSYSVQDAEDSDPLYYAEARSFNLSDFNLAYRANTADYISYSGKSARYVPWTYGQNVTSETAAFCTEAVRNTTTFPGQYYYNCAFTESYFRSAEYHKIITQRINGKSMHDYWVAAKCAGSKTSTYPSMGLVNISGNSIMSYILFTSGTDLGTSSSNYSYLRPIVKLNLEYVEFGVSGNGTSETPWRLRFPD